MLVFAEAPKNMEIFVGSDRILRVGLNPMALDDRFTSGLLSYLLN